MGINPLYNFLIPVYREIARRRRAFSIFALWIYFRKIHFRFFLLTNPHPRDFPTGSFPVAEDFAHRRGRPAGFIFKFAAVKGDRASNCSFTV